MCAKDKAEFSCLLHLVLNSKGNAAMNTFGTALIANPETIGRETTLLYFCVPLQGVGTLCVFSFLVYIKIYNMKSQHSPGACVILLLHTPTSISPQTSSQITACLCYFVILILVLEC